MTRKPFLSAPPVVLLAGLCFSWGAGAAEPPATLAQAVQAAYERSPDRPLAEARRREGEALRRKAAHPLAGEPTLTLRHQTDAVGEGNGYREWEAGMELPLWLPGQRDRRRREAERTGASAEALAAELRLRVAGELRERYWNAALARNERGQSGAALQSAGELERDIRHRVEAGELPRSDLILAQQETLLREDDLARAESRLATAERRFMTYTGLAAVPADGRESTPSATELPDSHARLALARAAVERARAGRDRVRGERRSNPLLWLGGKSEKGASGLDYESSLGIQVSIPLGSEAHAAPALAGAETVLTEAQAELGRVRRELNDALAQALLERSRATVALERARSRDALAAEGLRLARRAFELGETDLVRLLRARSAALQARHDLEAGKLRLGQAIARLNQALGVVPQ